MKVCKVLVTERVVGMVSMWLGSSARGCLAVCGNNTRGMQGARHLASWAEGHVVQDLG